MEMNTRIQVEHCVTEMISNVDLVREQIMVAAGEKLDFTQDDIVLRGHAIECRINAENPEKDFMPNPGTITGYVTPGGFGVRVDSHAYQDYSIPPYYDSMIGKLICWGRTRNEARRRMYRALKEYVITGVETTIPFHQSIIEDPVFMSGNFNTGFIEDFYKRTGKDKNNLNRPKIISSVYLLEIKKSFTGISSFSAISIKSPKLTHLFAVSILARCSLDISSFSASWFCESPFSLRNLNIFLPNCKIFVVLLFTNVFYIVLY